MLTADEREQARKLAQSIASALSDERLNRVGQAAHRLIDNIRELVGSDDDIAAKVAQMMAEYCASLEFVPAGVIGQTLDSTGTAYALAAGSLAGVYSLPLRKEEPELDGPQSAILARDASPEPTALPDAESEALWPGMYL